MLTGRRILLVTLLLSLALPAFAQQPEPSMEQQMREYMEKYATPGEHQKHLEMLAGKWTTKATLWMKPGAPPMESTGRAEHKMILGGRFLQSSYDGDFMGQPFAGMGLVAYDRYLNKYIETWIDSMGTMMMISEGSCEASGRVRTMLTQFDDPMTKKRTKVRSVYRVQDADHYTLEMYSQPAGSEEFKTMVIEHTRSQ